MKLTRKDFLKSAAAAALVAPFGGMREAFAQEYPSQDIRLICGFPAGSGADVFVRYFAEKLRPIAGRSVIVENKLGANSNVATEYVARSKDTRSIRLPARPSRRRWLCSRTRR
jgi:tripartite-type tricarboxylate transporter receptor subunit TctC